MALRARSDVSSRDSARPGRQLVESTDAAARLVVLSLCEKAQKYTRAKPTNLGTRLPFIDLNMSEYR
jgi:hypothetical protein